MFLRVFPSQYSDHSKNRVEAIRTAGSTADSWRATLLIELKAQIL